MNEKTNFQPKKNLRNKEIRIDIKFYLLPIQQEQLQHIDDAIIKKIQQLIIQFSKIEKRGKSQFNLTCVEVMCVDGETREKGMAFRRYHQ